MQRGSRVGGWGKAIRRGMGRLAVTGAGRHGVVMLVCVCLLLTACSDDEKKAAPPVVKPVKAMVVGEHEAGAHRAFPGTVVAGDSVDLAFRLSGQLQDLPVREGQHVRAGDVVARLDPTDYQTALRNVESQLLGARATLAEAKLNFERNSKLLESDTISHAAYDSAKATYGNAVAAVEALEQQQKQARLNLQYTELVAPYAGSIAAKYVKNFETVQAQEPVVRLENPATLDVEVEIPEFVYVLYTNLKNGSAVLPMVSFDAFPGREFPARLKEYRTVPNAQTRTYTVTMTIEKPQDIALQPGMTAEVHGKLPATAETRGFLLPASAVHGDSDSSFAVWTLDGNGTVHRRAVTVGEMQGNEIFVTSGLEGGEQVITAGVHFLHEGQAVRVLEGPIGGR